MPSCAIKYVFYMLDLHFATLISPSHLINAKVICTYVRVNFKILFPIGQFKKFNMRYNPQLFFINLSMHLLVWIVFTTLFKRQWYHRFNIIHVPHIIHEYSLFKSAININNITVPWEICLLPRSVSLCLDNWWQPRNKTNCYFITTASLLIAVNVHI